MKINMQAIKMKGIIDVNNKKLITCFILIFTILNRLQKNVPKVTLGQILIVTTLPHSLSLKPVQHKKIKIYVFCNYF